MGAVVTDDGVPEIAQVTELNVSPGGRAGETVQAVVAVPSMQCIFIAAIGVPSMNGWGDELGV